MVEICMSTRASHGGRVRARGVKCRLRQRDERRRYAQETCSGESGGPFCVSLGPFCFTYGLKRDVTRMLVAWCSQFQVLIAGKTPPLK